MGTARQGIWLLVADALGRGAMLLLHVYLVRTLRLEEYGVYSFVTAWFAYFIMFIGSGLDVVLGREAVAAPGSLRSLMGLVAGYRLVVACGAAAVNLALMFTVPALAPYRGAMLVYQVALFLAAFSLEWWVVGRGRVALLCWGRVVQVGAQCVAAVTLVWLRPEAVSALWAVLLGVGLVRVVMAVDFLRSERGQEPHPEIKSWGRLFVMSVPLLLGAAAGEVIQSFDQVMLGMLSTAGELGRYAACYKIVGLGMAVPGAFMVAAQPRVARALKEASRAGIVAALGNVFWLSLGCLVVPLAVLNVWADFWFNLLFGAQAKISFALLSGLSLSCLALAVAYLLNVTLTLWRGQWLVTQALFVAGVVNTGLNFWWIPRYGAEGAAWATFVAMALLCVHSGVNLFRRFKDLAG